MRVYEHKESICSVLTGISKKKIVLSKKKNLMNRYDRAVDKTLSTLFPPEAI